MKSRHLQVVLPIEELIGLDTQLQQEYPFVHACTDAGINDFIENALFCYRENITDDVIGQYVESFIDRLDYKMRHVKESLSTDEHECLTLSEIYSADFFVFIMTIFHKVIRLLKSSLCENKGIVSDDEFKYAGNTGIIVKLEIYA